jgi:CRISPR-associated protein Csd1
MFLKELAELYDTVVGKDNPPFYDRLPVPWIIRIDLDGNLVGPISRTVGNPSDPDVEGEEPESDEAVQEEVQDAVTGRAAGKPRKRFDPGALRTVPNVTRSSIEAFPFADTAAYVLGFPGLDPKTLENPSAKVKADYDKNLRKAPAQSVSFRNVVAECISHAAQNGSVPAAMRAVESFLSGLDLARAANIPFICEEGALQALSFPHPPSRGIPIPSGMNAADRCVFVVQGLEADLADPSYLPETQAYWAERVQERFVEDVPAETCLICGKTKVPATKHHIMTRLGKIKGQSTGSALIANNDDRNFESYNFQNALFAPVCLDCVERYGRTLNALIQREDSRFYLGSRMAVFWTDSGERDFLNILDARDPDALRRAFLSVETGTRPGVGMTDMFHCLFLTANMGRAAVSGWYQDREDHVRHSIRQWFLDQELVMPEFTVKEGKASPFREFYGLSDLAKTVCDLKSLEKNQGLKGRVMTDLFLSAFFGAPLSSEILDRALRRYGKAMVTTGSGKTVENLRMLREMAVLFKLWLLRSVPGKTYLKESGVDVEKMVGLNAECTSTGYLLGRLMAVLEDIQRNAMGGNVNATIVDRHFGAAISSPASVYPLLLPLAKSHLSKLGKDPKTKGLQIHLEKTLGGIMNLLEAKPASFPNYLTMEERAMFGLGYYHQRFTPKAKKEEEGAPLEEQDG